MATQEQESASSAVEGFKSFWSDRFRTVKSYTPFIKPDSPLPPWSDVDVHDFIATDPIHGPVLKKTRDAAKIMAAGGTIGAVSTAAFVWKYSKSPHGAVLSLGAGTLFGATFGQEIANHSLQLYKLDTMVAQVKFLEWWQRKSA